jgi:site-specific recombinase XerD
MRSTNTFGFHFIIRPNQKGSYTIYARIVVNKSKCELGIKQTIQKDDWNQGKGCAKSKTIELKQLNSYLEQVRSKLVVHYRKLDLEDVHVTAEVVKNSYLGLQAVDKTMTLNELIETHNEMMQKVLERGTMKNYYTTAMYIKRYMSNKYLSGDVLLKDLNFQFITEFEFYIRNNPLKAGDPCTNNGTMKHLERLKKMVAWAEANEWMDRNPFAAYKLKLKRNEMGFLQESELFTVETCNIEDPIVQRIRDLFIFSCYTGLAYIDLIRLKPSNIVMTDGKRWLRFSRKKTAIIVNIPLLKPAYIIMDRFTSDKASTIRETLFPKVTNQEMNKYLKVIGEICGVKKELTFHLARHTFATTVTLLNGVPIETISKLLGHTKLSTTMVYAHVMQSKVGLDMSLLQKRFDNRNEI